MLSKEFQLELVELSQGEVVLACMLMSNVDIQTLDSWGRAFPPHPLMPDFYRAIIGAAHGADAAQVIDVAKELLKAEYPELYEYLEGVYGNHSDVP